jgi:ATP-dependent RNA helicase DDX51/DBP6
MDRKFMILTRPIQEKTRAKQRYLRRKKERRKKNRKPDTTAHKNLNDDSEEEDEEDPSSQEDGETDRPPRHIPMIEEEPQNESYPKKRKHENDDVEMGDSVKENANEFRLPSPRPKSPPYALPSFPLPTLPDAPSKSVLALQGLDKALVDAEIVNPVTLLSISHERDGKAEVGLSKKTKKRLNDLGITELFAGMCRASFENNIHPD